MGRPDSGPIPRAKSLEGLLMQCPTCRSEAAAHAAFCPVCGHSFTAGMPRQAPPPLPRHLLVPVRPQRGTFATIGGLYLLLGVAVPMALYATFVPVPDKPRVNAYSYEMGFRLGTFIGGGLALLLLAGAAAAVVRLLGARSAA